jgi:CspA family cold shock protein
MALGKVKWFDPTKGFGFISPENGGADIFVHISKVQQAGISTLESGYVVQYEIVQRNGKSQAEKLILISAERDEEVREERQPRERRQRDYYEEREERPWRGQSDFDRNFDRDWSSTRYK